MRLHLDRHSGLPVYRQVLDQVRIQVASGILQPGDELPSTRALASDLGLNPMTVSKAYALLEREGLVERRPGLALVVRARGERELAADRGAELRRALLPAARAARQLGIARAEALETFGELLDHDERKDRRAEEGKGATRRRG